MATTCTSHLVAHRAAKTNDHRLHESAQASRRARWSQDRIDLETHLAIADRCYEVFPRGCGEVQHGAMSMLLGVADSDHLTPWRGSCLHAVAAGIAAAGLAPTGALDAVGAAIAAAGLAPAGV